MTEKTISILSHAEKAFKKIPTLDQIALSKKIHSLTATEIPGEEKLSGFSSVYRVRVGHYRIVYKRTETEIIVILIGHRKDIYRLLEQLLR